ncbi:hypothetical protein [Spirosoma aerolatum]|uniref:hypothetical protein n=1 Tax=Spirosoma aerolatum TaxID=1211326 RepID=UPI0009ABD486|nr:hypothetical protein [Spirosoma aerolatum]
MGTLQQFMSNVTPGSAATAHRSADYGSTQPKGNYIAVALVIAASLPDFGTNYTIGAGPAAPLGAGNIVAALKDLAYKGQCWFLGNGLVNGKAAKPVERKAATMYGSESAPRTTGEVAEKVDFTVRDTFANVDFWNSLRAGALGPLDVYLFTNTTVQCIRYASEAPVFDGIGYEMPGNYEQEIPGGFSVSWNNAKGQLQPVKGIVMSALKFETLRYTFAAATPAPTNLALVAGTTNRYNMVTGSAAKIKRVVNEGGAVRYSIFKNGSDDIPTAELVTIDSDTGEVNFGSAMPLGRYVYTIAAENPCGVYGTWVLEVIVKSA